MLYQAGNDVGIDTTTPKYALDVTGYINSSKGYRIGEKYHRIFSRQCPLKNPSSSSSQPERCPPNIENRPILFY
jgi:hypothetical protein